MADRVPKGAATLDKGLALFLSIVADGGETGLSTLASQAGLPTSTAQRIVAAFLRKGLVSRIGRGRYAAGLRLAGLKAAANPRAALIAASRPLLQRLAKDLSATVHLGVLEGEMVTYLVKAQGGGPDLLTSEMSQLEAYCSGIGKVLLAHLAPAAQAAYLAAGPFVALTSNTITDPAALSSAFERIAAQGYAFDEAELQDDLYCLAVPVRGPGDGVIAAISASKALGGWRDPSHIRTLKAYADRIGARLGRRS